MHRKSIEAAEQLKGSGSDTEKDINSYPDPSTSPVPTSPTQYSKPTENSAISNPDTSKEEGNVKVENNPNIDSKTPVTPSLNPAADYYRHYSIADLRAKAMAHAKAQEQCARILNQCFQHRSVYPDLIISEGKANTNPTGVGNADPSAVY